MKISVKSLYLALIFSFLIPACLNAAPAYLNYQGRLVDTTGNPLTGAQSILFSVYDAAGAGTLIWSETQNITPDNGIFSVTLGSVTPLPASVFSSDTRYLEVKIGTDAPMTPRTRLLSAPYALYSANLGSSGSQAVISTDVAVSSSQFRLGNFATLPGGMGEGSVVYDSTGKQVNFWNGTSWSALASGAASPWTGGGTGAVSLISGADKVGIGITPSTEKLEISGNVKVSGRIIAGSGTNAITTATGLLDAAKLTGDLPEINGSALTGISGDSLGNHVATTTLNMSAKAIINISSASITGAGVTGSSPLLQIAGSGMVVLNDGNVGIGEASPLARLHISSANAAATDILLKISTGTLYTQNLLIVYGGGRTYIGPDRGNNHGVLGVAPDNAGSVMVGESDYVMKIIAPSANALNISGNGNASDNTGEVIIHFSQPNLSDMAEIRAVNEGGSPYNRTAGLGFRTALPGTDGTLSEKMRITGTGNVGVGTAAPSSKFDVLDGSITVRGTNAGLILQDASRVITPETGAALGAGVRVSTNMYIVGFSSAAKYYGDGSSLTHITAAGDSLGNHIATTTLQMGAYGINSSSSITAVRYQIAGSTVLVILGTNGLGVGIDAGRVNAGNYNSFIGYNAGYNNLTGQTNSFVGTNAGFSNTTGGSNSFVGARAGYLNTTGGFNSFVGYVAGYYNTTGEGNSFVGYQAGYSNTTGMNNSFLGGSAGLSNTTGNLNSFMGLEAGRRNTTGSYNSFLGGHAGFDNDTGNYNSYIGNSAGSSNTTGENNSFVGSNAGYYNETGSANAILGAEAGYSAGHNSFSSSTLMGYQAGYGLTTGGNNILLGFKAGDGVTSGAGNIVIGYDQDTSAPGANNELNIGGVLYGNLTAKTIGISTRAPQAALDIVSTGTDPAIYAQIWRDGSGVIKSSMSATGIMMAAQFVGDGSGLTGLIGITAVGDGLGSHIATTTLQMGAYGINSSSSITAARYQIAGSTVLAISGSSLGVGIDAGRVNTGSYNSFVGYYAGYSNTGGGGNSFMGNYTGYYNTTGGYNSFLGYFTGYHNTTGIFNSFMGAQAGQANTTGEYNAFIGAQAGQANTTGSNNSFLGNNAGFNNTTGGDNSFVGSQAGYNVTTGTGNIVIGYNQYASAPGANNELNIGGVLYGDLSAKTIGISTRAPQAALDIVSTGTEPTIYAQIWRDGSGVVKSSMSATGIMMAAQFVGDGSGLTGLTGITAVGDGLGSHIATTTLQMGAYGINSSSSITAARYQIAGSTVLALLPGTGSLGVGVDAGMVNTVSGSFNSFVGYQAGYFNTMGSNNSFVGTRAGYSNTTGSYNSFIGSFAGVLNTTGYNNSFIGNDAGSSNTGGYNNSFVGHQAGQANTTGYNNSFVGYQAGQANTTGASNSFLGMGAGYSNTTGSNNSFVGLQAGNNTTMGGENSFMGYVAGNSNTTGGYNSFLGSSAGYHNTTGSNNSLVGYNAGFNNTTGNYNSFIGNQAGTYNIMGENNSLMGSYAGYYTRTGSANAIFGTEAGFGVDNNSFSSSTLMGYQAGYGLTTGGNNILLGFKAGDGVTSGAGNIVIGYDQDTSAPGANNELNIGGVLYGNLSAKTIGISTRAPQAALDIVSTGTATNIYAQIWRNGSGTITSSMTSTGVLYGDGSGLRNITGDGLGSHVATTTLQMGAYGVNTSSNITAARYQIAGSTVLSLLSGTDSLGIGVDAGRANTGSYNVFVGKNAGQTTTGTENTFVGRNAGQANIAGTNNAFVGASAGYLNTTGNYNSFIGGGAGLSNTTGHDNTFMGESAGYANATGVNNTFVGRAAGWSNTTGGNNSFMGQDAGLYTMTGSANAIFGTQAGFGVENNSFSSSTLMGYQAGYRLTTGSNNSFLGFRSGFSNTTGHNNSFVGDSAGYWNTTGNYNSFMGDQAGYMNTGSQNTFMGAGAGVNNTTGSNNSFVGNNAGYSNTTGGENSFFGKDAGLNNTEGYYNSFLGTYAGFSNLTGNSNSFVGHKAGYYNTTGYNNAFMGYQAGYDNTTGNSNSFMGAGAGQFNTTGHDNSFVGSYAGHYNDIGFKNTFVGSQAGYFNDLGQYNTFVGYYAGTMNKGSGNTFMGSDAGQANTSGAGNTFMGSSAGYSNTTALGNTFIGNYAGQANTLGWNNSFMGGSAGWSNTTGGENSFVGYFAGVFNQTGSANAVFGNEAGKGVSGNSFSSSTLMGYQAGYSLTTGNDNILLGFKAGDILTSGAGNIVIGYDQDTSGATAANELNIGGVLYGNLSTKTIGINNNAPASTLQVGTPLNATLEYTQLDTLNNDTAGAPPSTDCDASTEVGRMIISTRYSSTAEYRIWVCVKTGTGAFAWKYATLN